MTTSQNGYSAPTTPVSRSVPGGKIPVRSGPTGNLLIWVANQFHTRVEALVFPGCWGFAYREVRGATDLSNHASGTAIDLNAPRHPLGTNPTANFTAGQISAIHAIVAQTGGCVRWGGDYTGRKDPMHFEIVKPESDCSRVLSQLTRTSTPKLMNGNTDVRLPASPSTRTEPISLPPQAKVRLVFSANTVLFGGKINFWGPGVGQLLGTYDPKGGWRGAVNQGYQIDAPSGTTKAEIAYSCASEVDVFVQAVA